VAVHQRRYGGSRAGTHLDHMPSTHRFVAEWTPQRFERWARSIGSNTEGLIIAVLASRRYPEQAFRPRADILDDLLHPQRIGPKLLVTKRVDPTDELLRRFKTAAHNATEPDAPAVRQSNAASRCELHGFKAPFFHIFGLVFLSGYIRNLFQASNKEVLPILEYLRTLTY
jgi:hypothetical protein